MFSNNYKAVFELLGNNEKYNSFEKKSNQKIKANMLANQPANFEYLTEFKDEDESGLEERLRRINSVCSFTIQTAKAQTTMRDSVTAKTITVKHLVYPLWTEQLVYSSTSKPNKTLGISKRLHGLITRSPMATMQQKPR